MTEASAPEGCKPTGLYITVKCGPECSVMNNITVTLKEFKHFSGYKTYGFIIPFLKKYLYCLIRDENLVDANDDNARMVDEAAIKMLRPVTTWNFDCFAKLYQQRKIPVNRSKTDIGKFLAHIHIDNISSWMVFAGGKK